MSATATTNANGSATPQPPPRTGRDKWTGRYPHLGTGPLPADVFTSKEQFELEREHIFKKVWLNVGRIEQLPNAGDFFVFDIAMCETSILVVRGADGAVRAFHNMCSHRGNKVCWDRAGNRNNFTCKFHGWVYGLDGELRHVPDEEHFFDFQRGDHGMAPVACDVWEGFIFINVDPEPDETLAEYLGGMGESLTGYPFGEFSGACASWSTEVRANWKAVKDAFQETYHVAFLHKTSIPDSFTGPANPHQHILDLRLYPRHGSASLWGNAQIQPSPAAAIAFRHGAFLLRQDFDAGNLPPSVNPTDEKDWVLDLNVIFPCFFVDVSEGSYFTHNFWPLDVDRTIWTSTQYFPKPETAGQRYNQEYGHVLFRDIILEDGNTLEQTQSMLRSGAKTEFPIQDEEILVRHGHYVVDQMIHGRPLATPALTHGANGNGASGNGASRG